MWNICEVVAKYLFVDFTKAFDSQLKEKIEQILAYSLPKET